MQKIIVFLILIVVFAFIIWRLYKLFTRKDADNSRCSGCDIDCSLRDLQSKDCDKTKDKK